MNVLKKYGKIILLIAVVSATALGFIFAQNKDIGADEAKKYACADAGIDPHSTNFKKVISTGASGKDLYEVKFTSGNIEYLYWINEDDGSVLKKKLSVIDVNKLERAEQKLLSIDDAKNIVFQNAGLNESEIVLTSVKNSFGNDANIFELNFVKKNTEYKYKVNSANGQILMNSRENCKDGLSAKELNVIVAKEKSDKDKKDNDNKSNSLEQDSTKAVDNKADNNKDNSSKNDSTKGKDNSHNDKTKNTPSEISQKKAEQIAFGNAGVSELNCHDVAVEKDYENGTLVWEIEFKCGNYEYDYVIDAKTGAVIKQDVDYDD